MSIPEFNEIIEPNDQTEARREHLEKLRALIGNVYPNKYERTKISGAEDAISNLLSFEPIAAIAGEIKAHIATLGEGEKPAPEFKESLNAKLKEFGSVRISGRLAVPPRVMGKAAFVHLSDGANRLQIYVRKQDAKPVNNDTGELIETEGAAWELFRLLDHGDFVGAEGFLFLTNTGELSVHVETIQFLSKSLLPMPDKMHGISDPELQRRYRYADLIASSLQVEHEGLTTRQVFERRAKLISGMRRFLDDNGFVEVETPMLTPKATGAVAKPFKTHHNALDIELYARIAPELYLKRLTVGGFEKVYELNRNFRNEGLSQRHNPEFTMLEFYCAYMDVNEMMDFAEAMIKESVQKAAGSLQVKYGENGIDFSKFERLTMKQAINKFWTEEYKKLGSQDFEINWLDSPVQTARLRRFIAYMAVAQTDYMNNAEFTNYKIENATKIVAEKAREARLSEAENVWFTVSAEIHEHSSDVNESYGRNIEELFEQIVEENLIQPTFIIDYPKSISPLSKASPENPQIAERFELFINGMECANGFSELNDPQEQYERLIDQMKERETGDEEAMVLDEDYIRALAYGMPPAAGIGIGIDRLVMLLTNRHSIRDVILFPHMRPEKNTREESETGGASDSEITE